MLTAEQLDELLEAPLGEAIEALREARAQLGPEPPIPRAYLAALEQVARGLPTSGPLVAALSRRHLITRGGGGWSLTPVAEAMVERFHA